MKRTLHLLTGITLALLLTWGNNIMASSFAKGISNQTKIENSAGEDFPYVKFYSEQGNVVLSFINKTNKPVDINIYDITGSLVLSDKVTTNDINVRKEYDITLFPKGIYIVQLGNGNTISSHKFYLR